MRLTPRRRFVVAMLVSWPVGLLYLYWLYVNGLNVIRWYRSGYVDCRSTYITVANGCDPGTYSVTLAWIEILVMTVLMIAFGVMLGRWVMRPVGHMAETVSRLGPTSLGLRLREDGPIDESRRLADAMDELLATNARNEALIEGLLVLAETERGLVANTPQGLDLITAAVVETFRPTAKETGVEIDAVLQPVQIYG